MTTGTYHGVRLVEADITERPWTQAEWIAWSSRQVRNKMRAKEEVDVRALQETFDRLLRELSERVEQEYESLGIVEWNFAALRAFSRDQELFRELRDMADSFHVDLDADLRARITKTFQDEAQGHAWILDKATPPNVSINFAIAFDPDQIQALLDQPYFAARFSQRLGLITDDMGADIQQELTASMISGESFDDAAERLERVVGMSRNRAEMTARTEIIRAQSLARDQLYEDNADVIETVEWVATRDAKTDEDCAALDGLTGADLEAMASQLGVPPRPPAHPRCRCGIIPKTVSWQKLMPGIDLPDDLLDPTEMAVKNPESEVTEFVPFESFKDWRARVTGSQT